MKNAHRLGDGTPCGPSNVATVHQNTVFIEGKLAARVTDQCACTAPITAGSPTVFIVGQQAARLGDPIACPGNLVPNTAQRTYIGDYGSGGNQNTSGLKNAVPGHTPTHGTSSQSATDSPFQLTDQSTTLMHAFLDTIAWAEGTDPNQTGGGYDIGFGYRKINDLSHHPGTAGGGSSAAGRYQFLKNTWKETQKALNLPDFGPRSQDLGAIYLLRKKGVTPEMIKNDFQEAINRASFEWASFPTSTGRSRYSFKGLPQKARTLDDLKKVFDQAVKNRTNP